jgi:hypothetical protein
VYLSRVFVPIAVAALMIGGLLLALESGFSTVSAQEPAATPSPSPVEVITAPHPLTPIFTNPQPGLVNPYADLVVLKSEPSDLRAQEDPLLPLTPPWNGPFPLEPYWRETWDSAASLSYWQFYKYPDDTIVTVTFDGYLYLDNTGPATENPVILLVDDNLPADVPLGGGYNPPRYDWRPDGGPGGPPDMRFAWRVKFDLPAEYGVEVATAAHNPFGGTPFYEIETYSPDQQTYDVFGCDEHFDLQNPPGYIPPYSGWHVLTVDYISGVEYFYLDGVPVFTYPESYCQQLLDPDLPRNTRPDTLYAGNVAIADLPGDWSGVYVDWFATWVQASPSPTSTPTSTSTPTPTSTPTSTPTPMPLSLTTAAIPPVASPGSVVAFTVRLRNNRDTAATIYVTDSLPIGDPPAMSDHAVIAATSGVYTLTGQSLFWTPVLPPSAEGVITFTARINPGAANYGVVNAVVAVDEFGGRAEASTVVGLRPVYIPVVIKGLEL